MNRTQVVARILEAKRGGKSADFRRCTLPHDLSRIEFHGADLSGTCLQARTFYGSDLSRVNLTGATLLSANLCMAYMDSTIMPNGCSYASVKKNPLLGVWNHDSIIRALYIKYGDNGYRDVLMNYRGDLSGDMKYPEHRDVHAYAVVALLYSNRISLLRPHNDH